MARAACLNNLSISRHLSREVALQIPISHATDWPHAVAKLWFDRCTSLRAHQANISAWLAGQGHSKQEESQVVEWLVCCVPGRALFANLLTEVISPRQSHLELMAWLGQVDKAITILAQKARWLRQPLADDTLRKRSGCGGTPIGMIAARMGRPHLLLGNGVVMTTGERKSLIGSAHELGLWTEAVGLFEEAGDAEKQQLSDTVWRGISSHHPAGGLPSCDPPLLWWDRIIKQSSVGEYPLSLSNLVQLRPHLAEALAAAMLRSGIREVAAMAHAQPGLAMADLWPGRDGNKLPALGVVVDSWVSSLTATSPSPIEKMDLSKKAAMVVSRLPPAIGETAASKNWTRIGQCLYWEAPQPGNTVGIVERSLEMPSWADLCGGLLSEWRNGMRAAPPSSWRRWAEIATLATAGLSQSDGVSFPDYIERLLPFVRQLFLDLYLGATDRSSQKAAEQTMDHLLGLPCRLDLIENRHYHSNLEWELWTLFTDRSAATAAWNKPKEMTGRPGRTLRQIEKMMGAPAALGWSFDIAGPFQRAMADDEYLPEWLQAFLQKEALRLSSSGDGGALQTRERGRL